MKVLDAYQIPILSLEDKSYRHTFEGADDFFQAFEQEWVEKGQFSSVVELNKSASMIQVELKIEGSIRLICDRSLEEFDYPFEVDEKLIYKYADHSEEMGNNLFLLDRKSPKLDLSQDLFDFIALQVPMKKLHPRYLQEAEALEGNQFIYSTEKVSADQATEKAEKDMDPRWAALKNLKDNN
jgi:uncharacterized metal-binding protein YceD (DUF177 family)